MGFLVLHNYEKNMTTDTQYVFKRLEISGYKSIQDVVIEDIPPLMVLAGSNGSGKSNFVDSLELLSKLISENIEKLTAELQEPLSVKYQISDSNINYELAILENHLSNERLIYPVEKVNLSLTGHKNEHKYSIDKRKSELESKLNTFIKQKNIVEQNYKKIKALQDNVSNLKNPSEGELSSLQVMMSEMMDILKEMHEFENNKSNIFKEIKKIEKNTQEFPDFSIVQVYQDKIKKIEELNQFVSILTNIKTFRINPFEAKKPTTDNVNLLKADGSNIANILANLEKNDEMRETIIEWLSLIVPEMMRIESDSRRIDGSKMIQFEEESGKKFPAHLVSDGTIYALCMLVAVLTRTQKPGITIIEEPERGLHPKAIGELVSFMREHASHYHPIILTTHSESVVRELELDELFFVSKENGKTQIKSVKDSGVDKNKIPLDTAWLTNTLGGGLPW